MICLINCVIYTGDEVFSEKVILIEDGLILDLVSMDSIPQHAEIIDCHGRCVAPGFIDLQVNGGGGVLFNDEITEEGIEKIKNAHLKFGVTSFLPTLITCDTRKIFQAIDIIKQVMSRDSSILGLHVEGPFINKIKAGVHEQKYIIENPSKEIVEEIVTEGKDIIKMLTLAPEVVSRDIIDKVYASGVLMSIGHSNATSDEIEDIVGERINCATHLFNAMSPYGSREPGVVGTILDQNIPCGIIVDGHHVHYKSVRVAKKILKENLFLVTDAMPPVGCLETTFKIGEYSINYDGERCVTEEGILAGSCLNMAQAIFNCVNKVGIPFDEALRMSSLYPARVLGLDHTLGRIKKGYKADLVVFDHQLNIYKTIVDGKVV